MRARLGPLLVAAVLVASGTLVATSPRVAFAAPFNPDGRIAYADDSLEGGIFAGLRTCPAAGQCDERRLTSDSSDAEPAWSPTGRQIAFSRAVGEDRFIFVLDVTTGRTTRLTGPDIEDGVAIATSDSNPDWSPDGSLIAFGRRSHLGVVIAFVSTASPGAVRRLPDRSFTPGPCSNQIFQRSDPTFSPDGTKIAYTANAVAVAGASAPRPLLAAAGSDPGAWLPLLVSSTAAGTCPTEGVWISGTGSHDGETRIAPALGPAWAPAWAPDGSAIALETNTATYVVPFDGRAPIAIKDSLGNVPHGSSQPGGLFGGGLQANGHVAWDPASAFLVIDAPVLSADIAVKYKPDGSGDLDLPAGTVATSSGWSVQCTPATCLTSLTIERYTSGPGGKYPATFHYAGSVTGDITVDELFGSSGQLTARVRPGRATVTETTTSTWGLGGIECDVPADIDLPNRTVSLDIAVGITAACVFYTDLPPPTEAPTAGPDETTDAACSNLDHYHGRWVAGQYGKDTLDFQVEFDWCHGDGGVAVQGPIDVRQSVGDFFLPSWLSFFSFDHHDDEIVTSAMRTSDSTIDVHAEGSFTWCTSALQIASEILPEFKVLREITASKYMPGFMRKLILKRIAGPLKLWMYGAIRTAKGEWIRLSPAFVGGAADAAFDEMLKVVDELLNEVIGILLGYVPNGNSPLLPVLAPGLINFCVVETWHPDVTITIDSEGNAGAVLRPERTSPFWDVRQLLP